MRIQSAVLLALVVVVMPASTTAQTAPAFAAKNGVTFSVGASSNDLSFRHVVNPRWAALGTIGYGKGTSLNDGAAGPSIDVTTWSLGVSGRRYAAAAELRPFVEAGVGIRVMDIPHCEGPRTPYGTAGGGVEYNIAPRVSIEGSAGLSYSSSSERCRSEDFQSRYDYQSWSTFRTSLSITFYF